jgi:hypothetical protein
VIAFPRQAWPRAISTHAGPERRPGKCRRYCSMRNLQVKNSGTFQECRDNAIHWEQRAVSARDPTAKTMFAEIARCWRELARYWRDLEKQS